MVYHIVLADILLIKYFAQNIRAYYMLNHLITCIYPTRANGIIALVNCQTGFCRRFLIPQFYKRPERAYNREFKKLRRQLQGKRHIKIELCVNLSLLRLFHVYHVVQNRRCALSLAWHEWFSWKGKEWKIYCCELPLSSEPQIWKFHVVVWQTTSKHCTKTLVARAARLFFFIQPIKSLICGGVVDVAVVKS